jgi:hypothetical protein
LAPSSERAWPKVQFESPAAAPVVTMFELLLNVESMVPQSFWVSASGACPEAREM